MVAFDIIDSESLSSAPYSLTIIAILSRIELDLFLPVKPTRNEGFPEGESLVRVCLNCFLTLISSMNHSNRYYFLSHITLPIYIFIFIWLDE